eukprot:tig00020801_g13882.t1
MHIGVSPTDATVGPFAAAGVVASFSISVSSFLIGTLRRPVTEHGALLDPTIRILRVQHSNHADAVVERCQVPGHHELDQNVVFVSSLDLHVLRRDHRNATPYAWLHVDCLSRLVFHDALGQIDGPRVVHDVVGAKNNRHLDVDGAQHVDWPSFSTRRLEIIENAAPVSTSAFNGPLPLSLA